MPNRYNGRDEDNIPNTDNQETMLLPNGVSGYTSPPKQELPPLRRVNRRSASQPSAGGTSQQAPRFPQSGQPPQFPHSEQPPQFPHSAPPPQPNYSEPQYYDYNQQSPQEYSGYSDGGYYPPPAAPQAAPPPPPRPPQKRKRPAAPQPDHEERPKKKKRRHKSLLRRIVGRLFKTVLVLFLLLFGLYSCTSVSLIKKMEYKPSESRNHYADSLGRGHVRSILVIGTDGRTADEVGRSDSMILVSLNSKTNEMIMTSFMRDCYVEIPNNGWNKLNAAYAFGGADLLMDTIELNFDVRIDDYVSVDFASFVSLVDSVGGIDIEVSDAEAQEINVILISEVNGLMGDPPDADLLSGGGKLHLNGKQALSYSRIRKVGNSDFERTERQRRVMSLIIAKMKTFKPSIFKNLASDVIPDVATNMSTPKAYLLSLRAPFALKYKTKQIQIPAEGTFTGADVDVGNVLQVDFGANREVIDKEVFSKD
ncbi:LCP family protein [Ruminococcus flavefaciens]|uniref:LCP family protein n=1 Tax=Ruminococcus flavefaciens TaxID=1265 RepID=UPI0026EF344A|nr:LCP family protein [Ruminococcus flavefaciens]